MAGILSRLMAAGLDRFCFRVSVSDVSEPAAGFRLITLAGSELTEHKWQPGDKVMVRTPEDELRTYSPFDWDATAGSARLLGAGHASGPGTRFLKSLAVGNEVQLLGPKRSVDFDLETAPIIVGDETTLGSCAAWAGTHPDLLATVLLEATDIAACQAAAQAVGVSTTQVVGSRDALTAATIEAVRANPAAPLILSGRAQTIAAIRRALKDAAATSGAKSTSKTTSKTTAKAYWDENRAGLD